MNPVCEISVPLYFLRQIRCEYKFLKGSDQVFSFFMLLFSYSSTYIYIHTYIYTHTHMFTLCWFSSWMLIMICRYSEIRKCLNFSFYDGILKPAYLQTNCLVIQQIFTEYRLVNQALCRTLGFQYRENGHCANFWVGNDNLRGVIQYL